MSQELLELTPTIASAVVPPSRRNAAKAERRGRIVDAAADLVREVGYASIAMVDVARRARVSPATLYNLFQTKAAIFEQVFARDLEDYVEAVEAAPARDEIERIFVSVDIAVQRYARDPAFYKALARGGGADEALDHRIARPRTAFWQDRIARATQAGALRPGTPAEALGIVLTNVMIGALLRWASDSVTVDRLAAEAHYGVALCLLPYAETPAAQTLAAQLSTLEHAITSVA